MKGTPMSDDPICEAKLPIVDKETFKNYSQDSKLDTLYDLNCIALNNQALVLASLRKRRKVDTTVAGGLGFMGGFVAVFLKKLVGW